MATTTSNLGLTKPAENESYNIDVFNNNTDKIDQLACIGAAMGQTGADLGTVLYHCTGSIVATLKCHVAGKIAIIEGRFVINNYARTGANPGFTFDLPNGAKSKYSQNTSNIGVHGNTNGVSVGENTQLTVNANSGNVMISVTETYANFTDDTRAFFLISPTIITLA